MYIWINLNIYLAHEILFLLNVIGLVHTDETKQMDMKILFLFNYVFQDLVQH